MLRQITFVIEGEVSTRIKITENDNGTLTFDLQTLTGGIIGDLRALFFDLDSSANVDSLSVSSGADVTNLDTDEAGIASVGTDTGIYGKVINELGNFDVGIEFGRPGIATDDIQSTTFTLSSSEGALSLDSLDLQDFGIRYTSVGEDGGDRSTSLKLGDQSNGVAQNDAFDVDENTTGSTYLLSNDTHGATNTVTAVEDTDGAFGVNGSGEFERVFVFEDNLSNLLTLGTLTIDSVGNTAFSATGADVDALAEGETAIMAFSYTTTAADGTSFATAIGTVTVVGTNDAPDITVGAGDSADDTLNETNAGLTASGTLSLSDADISDVVSVAVTGVTTSGNAGSLIPATLQSFLKLTPTTALDGTQTTGGFQWDFDSVNEAFDYLAADEKLTLFYTVTASDDNSPAGTDTQAVTVTINGTNDAPDITVGAGDSADDTLNETNTGLTASGTLSLSDADISDVVSVAVTGVTTSGNAGSLIPATLQSFLKLTPTTVLNGTQTAGSFQWDFNSGSEAFDYLAAGDKLTLIYTVTASDDNSPAGTDTQAVTVTINGTNNAPSIGVVPTVGDNDLIALLEDSSLTGSATLSVLDADTTDVVTATVSYLGADDGSSGTGNLGALGPADLPGLLSVLPAPVLDATQQSGQLTFSFDAGSLSFDHLAKDEILELNYRITVDDANSGSDYQDVTVKITGTNSAPTVDLKANKSFNESDAALSFTRVVDIEDSDGDALTLTTSLATSGDQTDQLDENALLAAFNVNPATGGGYEISFDSAPQTFDFLSAGESLKLTYTVKAEDPGGLSDQDDIVITVNGTNDAIDLSTYSITIFDASAPGGTRDVVVGNRALLNETDDILKASGLFLFDDPDLSDTFTITAAAATAILVDPSLPGGRLVLSSSGSFGTLTANNPQAVNNLGEVIGWNFESAGEDVFDFLDEGQSLELNYIVKASDGTGSDSEAVTIVVQGENDAPVAVPDIIAASGLNEDLTGLIGPGGQLTSVPVPNFLANDTDPEGQTLSYANILVTGYTANPSGGILPVLSPFRVANGTIVSDGSGGFLYTPNNGF